MKLSILLLFSAAGCEERAAERQVAPPAGTGHRAAVAAVGSDRIDCAPAGAAQLTRVCRIERSRTDQGMVLTIRHPEGGFRRLLVVEDGRGVLAADGAEPAQVTLVGGNEIDVTIGDDRYRLPATRKALAQ